MRVWCVMHREGWCATSAQKRRPNENKTSFRTACRHYVVMPWRISKRSPSCETCRKRLAKAPGGGEK